MGDKTVSDEMQMYSHVFSVLGKCTDDYLFVLDLQNNRYMISDSATKIFPFEATEMSNAFKALESIVYPQDYPMLEQNLQDIITGRSTEHDMEYRWVGRNGKPVWISCRGQVVNDADGKPEFLIGRITDIGKVYRMGGDEMAILVPGIFHEKKEDPAKALYKKIRDKIDQIFSEGGHMIYFTISAGSVYFHKEDRDVG